MFTQRLALRKAKLNERLAIAKDKLASHWHIEQLDVPVPRIWIGNDVPENLPTSYVLKSPLGHSGRQVILMDADFDLLRKWRFNRAELISFCADWRRPLILEQRLFDETGNPIPIDYKYYAFGGTVKTIMVCNRWIKGTIWRSPEWCETMPALDTTLFPLGEPRQPPKCLLPRQSLIFG